MIRNYISNKFFLAIKCGPVQGFYGLQDSSLAVELHFFQFSSRETLCLYLMASLFWITYSHPSLPDSFILSTYFIWRLYFNMTWWDLDSTTFALDIRMLYTLAITRTEFLTTWRCTIVCMSPSWVVVSTKRW